MQHLRTTIIAPDTPECHASFVHFHSGRKIVAWFGGEREGNCCSVFLQAEGYPVQTIPCPPEDPSSTLVNSLWNPVLFSGGDTLYVMFKSGGFCDRWETHVLGLSLKGDDITPVGHQMLPAGLHGSTKGSPLFMPELGVHLFGASSETRASWSSHVEAYAIDAEGLTIMGRSLPLSIPGGHKGIIQPVLWKQNGFIHMLCRSDAEALYYSKAPEGDPLNFSLPTRTNIANPNSAVDVLTHSGGQHLLAFNPSTTRRDPLVIAFLDADGDTLRVHDPVEVGNSSLYTFHTHGRTRELSYPNMAEDPEGGIHIAYTCCRCAINVAELCLEDGSLKTTVQEKEDTGQGQESQDNSQGGLQIVHS
jgi:predicted neuraminidase